MDNQIQGRRERNICSRGNSAQKSKDSILVETINLITSMHKMMPNITQLQRREGAWREMKLALLQIIRDFNMARSNTEPATRKGYIDKMIGEMGVVDAMFGELLTEGVLTDKEKLKIAQHMDRMESGIILWRDATKRANLRSQADGEVGVYRKSSTVA